MEVDKFLERWSKVQLKPMLHPLPNSTGDVAREKNGAFESSNIQAERETQSSSLISQLYGPRHLGLSQE